LELFELKQFFIYAFLPISVVFYLKNLIYTPIIQICEYNDLIEKRKNIWENNKSNRKYLDEFLYQKMKDYEASVIKEEKENGLIILSAEYGYFDNIKSPYKLFITHVKYLLQLSVVNHQIINFGEDVPKYLIGILLIH
jgi:hypothetical protein